MLTIIIGIVLAVGVFLFFVKSLPDEPKEECISCYYDKKSEGDFSGAVVIVISLILIVISIFLGVFYPLQGYSEPVVVKEEELISFSNENEVYLLDYGEEYLYKILSNKDEEKGNIYETKTVEKCNAKKQKFENCEEPVLIIYERKPVSGIWTFALCDSEEEYMFEVPKNTIKYSIKSEITKNVYDDYVSYVIP